MIKIKKSKFLDLFCSLLPVVGIFLGVLRLFSNHSLVVVLFNSDETIHLGKPSRESIVIGLLTILVSICVTITFFNNCHHCNKSKETVSIE